MGSIYEIPSWSAGTASKNEVYLHNSNHFYSLEDSNTKHQPWAHQNGAV